MHVRRVRSDAVIPSKTNDDDVGYDLTVVALAKTFEESGVQLYDTGLQIRPPPGYYIEVVPRSSISKTHYALANSVGIIDPDYRGNILVALRKTNVHAPDLRLPCRIAQLILRKQERCVMFEVDELDWTERGEGGFGSTDAKAENVPALKSDHARVVAELKTKQAKGI